MDSALVDSRRSPLLSSSRGYTLSSFLDFSFSPSQKHGIACTAHTTKTLGNTSRSHRFGTKFFSPDRHKSWPLDRDEDNILSAPDNFNDGIFE